MSDRTRLVVVGMVVVAAGIAALVLSGRPPETSPPVASTTTATEAPTTTFPAVQACESSSPAGGAYTVEVCLRAPAADVTGRLPVTADVTVDGEPPGVRRLVFSLDGSYLLTDFEAPYQFELPADHFEAGPHQLAAEAILRDEFVTGPARIDLTFAEPGPTVAPPPFRPRTGNPPAPGSPFLVAATGDGAAGRGTGDDVIGLIESWQPQLLLYLGDVYEQGTYTEFHNWYGHGGSAWSGLWEVTNPVIGNHELLTPDGAGFRDYWGGPPPHYSFDTAGWHLVGLDLQKDGADEAELAWLTADLAASDATCSLVFQHTPVVSVGPLGDNPALAPAWQAMAAAGVDLLLTAHEHNYQRWRPLGPDLRPGDGPTQFVVGTGGHGIQERSRDDPRAERVFDQLPTALGALRLELNPEGAVFAFVNTEGEVLDRGVIQCSGTGPDRSPPAAPEGLAATAGGTQVALSWSPSADRVGVDRYRIVRDGALLAEVQTPATSFVDLTATPDGEHVYRLTAIDAAGNESPPSRPLSVATGPAPTLFEVPAAADTYVTAERPAETYGDAKSLRFDGRPVAQAYLRFDLPDVPGLIASARLRVYLEMPAPEGFSVHQVLGAWNEASLVYAGAPPPGNLIARTGPEPPLGWVELDVTAAVEPGRPLELVIISSAQTSQRISSREGEHPPELVIETEPGS